MVAWNTKKMPSRTCRTHNAIFIDYLQPSASQAPISAPSVNPTIVSVLTMGKPDIKVHAPLTHGDLTVDGSGYLYDAAMRRAVVENGGGGSVDVFEALAD